MLSVFFAGEGVFVGWGPLLCGAPVLSTVPGVHGAPEKWLRSD